MSTKHFFIGLSIVGLALLAGHAHWSNYVTRMEGHPPVSLPPRPAPPSYVVDQCVRADLYKACLLTIPPGNPNVVSSQWDDVKVRGCTASSAKLAIRLSTGVEEKCAIPIPPNLDNY